MHMKKEKIQKLQKAVFVWYKKNGRHNLPWRRTNDVYHIAVAEIMLQQTNVPKVICKYEEFIQQYPTVDDLARASQRDVVLLWQGLGYNRRAVYLYKMAKIVVFDYEGIFKKDIAMLESLPGIGSYTSRSILIFAYNKNITTRDVNINRLVRRIYEKKEMHDKTLAARVSAIFPHRRSRDWHNALMDIASAMCTKRLPKCTKCPLHEYCKSFPNPNDYVKTSKKEIGRNECNKHVPRRIYRGRIIEYLRTNNGNRNEIGSNIKADWNVAVDDKWLEEILQKLKKEGMIMCKDDIWVL